VHRPEQETEKLQNFQQELQSVLSGLNTEQQETGVRAYLLKAAEMTNHSRLQLLLSLLENLVAGNILPARYVKMLLLAKKDLIKMAKFMSVTYLLEASEY
jgi:hypothetical protein